MINYSIVERESEEYFIWHKKIKKLLESSFNCTISYRTLDVPTWWVIATCEGVLVANGGLTISEKQKSVYLSNFCVSTSYRRKGVGSALFTFCCDFLSKYHYNILWWEVRYQDIEAHMFYIQNNATFIGLVNAPINNNSLFKIDLN